MQVIWAKYLEVLWECWAELLTMEMIPEINTLEKFPFPPLTFLGIASDNTLLGNY